MIALYNDDNIKVMSDMYDKGILINLVYCDFIYENLDFRWVDYATRILCPDGIIIFQTDWHSVTELDQYLKESINADLAFVNHLVWKNEWGNHPKNRFHQCYDDILIYCRGTNWKFYSDRIQVPKATAKTNLNPSGRETKTATAWIDDICLTTTSKERIKKNDGHLVKWQKPMRLMDRLLFPFTDEGDLILEPFGGTFSACRWAKENNRNAIGIEYDKTIFELAKRRINMPDPEEKEDKSSDDWRVNETYRGKDSILWYDSDGEQHSRAKEESDGA